MRQAGVPYGTLLTLRVIGLITDEYFDRSAADLRALGLELEGLPGGYPAE